MEKCTEEKRKEEDEDEVYETFRKLGEVMFGGDERVDFLLARSTNVEMQRFPPLFDDFLSNSLEMFRQRVDFLSKDFEICRDLRDLSEKERRDDDRPLNVFSSISSSCQ